jgi:hypothetical protein
MTLKRMQGSLLRWIWKKVFGRRSLYSEWLDLVEKYYDYSENDEWAEYCNDAEVKREYERLNGVKYPFPTHNRPYLFNFERIHSVPGSKAWKATNKKVARQALLWKRCNSYRLWEYFVNNSIKIGHPGHKRSEQIMMTDMMNGKRTWFEFEWTGVRHKKTKFEMNNKNWLFWSPIPFKKKIALKGRSTCQKQKSTRYNT